MKVIAGLVVALVCAGAFGEDLAPRSLTFEERVRAQEAIERVYYAHQLGATKPFEQAVPRSVLEAKVHKYLEQTAALQTYWKTAVTDDTLQRELERMAAGTRMPERLQELYTALGNDPLLIKECLARATLVDRLAHNFYAFDSTMHAAARARAEELHRQLVAGELSPKTEHPNRRVSEIVVGEQKTESPRQQSMSLDEFKKLRAELPSTVGSVSAIEETREGFVFSVVLSETASGVRVANYLIQKITWESWWGTAKSMVGGAGGPGAPAVATRDASLPTARAGLPIRSFQSCVQDDTWDNGSLDDMPSGSSYPSAVWTGNVMIVWGGGWNVTLNSGGRYDPVTDTWAPTSTLGAPSGRVFHTAVWTGAEMIVWGGHDDASFDTGGRYDPVADAWTTTSTTNAPQARYTHNAVWTGSVMAIWGGSDDMVNLNTGGRYDPATDTWLPTSLVNAPSARSSATAIWTGTSMVIWGGYDGSSVLDSGGRYDPVADTWTRTSTVGAPQPRVYHVAVWTGSQMLVWSGQGQSGTVIGSGGRYDPASDSWTSMSQANAPRARVDHTAIWTGSRMIVWGGFGDQDLLSGTNTGGEYDPIGDFWLTTSTSGAPSKRYAHTAVWTGTLMIVWGGFDNTGGRFDPVTNSWTPTSTGTGPSPRSGHTAVWTGNEMIIWGGDTTHSGAERYDAATDAWATSSLVGAPEPRSYHSAAWTGNELMIWGGRVLDVDDTFSYRNTGSRYDPIADHWTPVSTLGAPSARADHTAVWTGSQMLVWGGDAGSNSLALGGKYNPATDSWTLLWEVGAPLERSFHTAIWTGHEMVVWGGQYGGWSSGNGLGSGGRYDPILDRWTVTSNVGAPSPRKGHSTVWTGNRMLVWGGNGDNATPTFSTGGQYDPATDTWTPTSLVGAPSPRMLHSAVWTGREMVIWAGKSTYYNYGDLSTGGRYDPAADTWTATSMIGTPPPRAGQTAVWTGNFMIVWGGILMGSGGRYFLGASNDNDGDGFTACQGDCNDQRSTIYPGAPQVCDGLNNDCDDPAWPTPPAIDADTDGDGFSLCQGDCDDTRGHAYPGASELCNGIDDDCDHVIDEGDDALCNDANACNGIESCDSATGCVLGEPLTCNDGNVCNGLEVCAPATGCVSGTPLMCDDHNACTDDSCEPATGCAFNIGDSTSCDDGDACTEGDYCVSGACTRGSLIDCDDDNVCTADSCDWSVGCTHTLFPASDCDDGNPCTRDECDPVFGCVSPPSAPGIACNDFFSCTGPDLCDGQGSCVGQSVCDDGNPCSDDFADEGNACACSHGPTYPGTECSDGNSCTVGDTCDGDNHCVAGPGPGPDCDDANPCTDDSCDPALGCVHASNAVACNDGNACTTGDVCSGGACGGSAVNCNDDNACTDDNCNPASGCAHTNNTSACDDGNSGTSNDVCSGGVCGGTPTCNTQHPRPRSSGYYERLCDHHRWGNDGLTDADAVCVGELSETFAGISDVDAICDVLDPDFHGRNHGHRHCNHYDDHPANSQCDKAEKDLMALALNICRGRVCESQGIDSHCQGSDNTTVGQSFAEADAILAASNRSRNTCRDARCLAKEINNGHALEMTSLRSSREGAFIRLSWLAPDLDDGTGHATSYTIGRRVAGADSDFVPIGTTGGLSFLDTTAGAATYEYEVSAEID